LIKPDPNVNKFTKEEILEIIKLSKSGQELQEKLLEMKLQFTEFDGEEKEFGEQTSILEVLAVQGCCPPPQGVMCPMCQYAIYGLSEEKFSSLMHRHTREKHAQRYSSQPLSLLFNCYSNDWREEFYDDEIAFDLADHPVEMGRCPFGECDKVCQTYHEANRHCGKCHDINIRHDFSPFWKLIKINVELGNEDVSMKDFMIRKMSHISAPKYWELMIG
jgi:hypothetical protein